MKDYWVKNDGFISNYFLYIFLLILICLTIILNNKNNELKTIANIKTYNKYFEQEYKAIYYLKDIIYKDKFEGEELLNNNDYIIDKKDNHINIVINEPLYEEINVYVDWDNKIITDYEVNRYIEEAFID